MAKAKYQKNWRNKITDRKRMDFYLPNPIVIKLDNFVRENGLAGRGEAIALLIDIAINKITPKKKD